MKVIVKFVKIYSKKTMQKLYAIIGKIGVINTASELGLTYPTLKSRLDNPDNFKQSEIKAIDKLHEKTFKNDLQGN